MGGGRKRRRVVSDEEWEKDRDDHVPARLAVLSAKGTREVEDKLVLSRLRHFTNTAQDVSKGSNLDSEETKMHTGSPRPESHRLKMFRSSSSKDFPMKTEKNSEVVVKLISSAVP